MIVVKYFHEEPAALEQLAADAGPDARAGAEPRTLEAFLSAPSHFRGYLAATDLETGATGATAGSSAEAWVDAVIAALGRGGWWTGLPDATWQPADPARVLAASAPGTTVVTGPGAPAPDLEVVEAAGGLRRSLPALRALLDAGMTVLVAEPAPDGADWSVFDARPLADRLRSAFAARPAEGVRRFVIPFREARGEHRFYFERYDLALYAHHEVP